MSRMNRVRKGIVFSMMMGFTAASMQVPVMADMIDNAQLATQAELQMQRSDLRSILAREDVRKAMLAYGVSSADVDQRINNMSSGELSQIHGQLATLPAGEGAGSTLLAVVLIVFILEIFGITDIFPGI